MCFYKVVNSGNRIKIQVCLTLHYSSHLPQGSLVSMSSLTAQRQGGQVSCGQAKGGHICLRTQRQPSWVRTAHEWQVFFQVSGHTQFRTKEACRRNEWSGAARQVVFIKDPNKNKSGKAKSLNPKGQANDGSKYIAAKKGTWELATGVLENLAKALSQKVMDGTQQERTIFPRHDSLFAPSPTPTFTYPFSSLSPSSPHMLLYMHTHTHTDAATMFLRAPGCWLLLFIQTCLESKVKMSASKIELTVLCLCLLHLKARMCIPFLFLSPSQHLLLDTICSACTWHSINAFWMADFSCLPHPFLPTPTALL